MLLKSIIISLMLYYININSWNLLESFVSESISPFSFYQNRGYGNNLSRYMDETNERTNYLILSTKEIKGDYVLKVSDDILDKSNLVPVKKCKTLYTYNKTIYYKKEAVAFLFSSRELLESLVAESQILFEVKCIDKYKSDFIVAASKALPLSTDIIENAISFQLHEYIKQDSIYDRLKGMIVAYTRAIAFAKNPKEQSLMCMLRDLKNSFAGLNTQVMVSETAVLNESKYISLIQTAKEAYKDTVNTRTNLFDILTQRFAEIVKLAKARAEEISRNKPVCSASIRARLMDQKDVLENKLYSLESKDGISDLIEELNSIKKQERDNGIKLNKKREYFKKGSWEYERKNYLKQEIKKYEDENYEFKSIKQQIADIRQRLSNIESGSYTYDTTLGDLFVRVSDIMNELISKAKTSGETNGNIDYSCFSLNNLAISINVQTSDEEKVFLDVIMNEALMGKLRVLSDEGVLSLIVESANKYKCLECSNTEKGKQILGTLREFWAYKHNQCSSFSIPDNLVVLKSLMAFFIKPFGFDQIDRYAQNRGIECKEFGYMLRGAIIGYAAFPKTFTDVLYANADIYIPMDEYLTVIHKLVETQYFSCT